MTEGQKFVGWLKTRVNNLSSLEEVEMANHVSHLPRRMIDNLKRPNVWGGGRLDHDDVTKFLRMAGEFFEGSDKLRRLFDAHLQDVSFESLLKLVSHDEWLASLRHTDFEANAQAMRAAVMTPTEFLASMPPLARKELFLAYADKYIPESVQKEHPDIFKPTERKTEDRFKEVNRPTVLSSLKGILGEGDVPEDEALKIAEDSLKHEYNVTDEKSIPHRFQKEYFAAVRNEKFSAQSDEKPKDIKERLRHSRLRGMMSLGLGVQYIDAINQDVERWDADRDRVHIDVQQRLLNMTAADEAQLRRESETAATRFASLEGWQKLMLYGSALYAGWKIINSKSLFWKSAAGTLGAIYVIEKFFIGHDSPTKKWAEWASGGIDWARDKSPSWSTWTQRQKDIKDIGYRAELGVKFLPYEQREKMRLHGLIYAALIGQKVRDVAVCMRQVESGDIELFVEGTADYVPGAEERGKGANVDPNYSEKGKGGILPLLRTEFRGLGWKTSEIDKFFRDSHNQKEAGTALRHFFYRLTNQSAQKDKWIEGRIADDKKLVEKEVKGGRYDMLRGNAKEAYNRIVALGIKIGMRMNNEKIEEFLIAEVGKPSGEVPMEDVKQEAITKALAIMQLGPVTVNPGTPGSTRDVEMYFQSQAGKKEYIVKIPRKEFVNPRNTTEALYEKWRQYAVAQVRDAINETPNVGQGVQRIQFQVSPDLSNKMKVVYYQSQPPLVVQPPRTTRANVDLKRFLERSADNQGVAKIIADYRDWALTPPGAVLPEPLLP